MAFALVLYFSALSMLVIWSSRNVKSETDFIIGNRSLNFWLTALAAHASDMSSWLFMGYPALIYTSGLFSSWVALGLIVCMFLNWQLVASKFRKQTGDWKCSTFSGFLHKRFEDHSGLLQLSSALFCFVFYVVYVCSGLIGLGLLGEALFNINYSYGILAGSFIVILYVIFGGYVTLAWIDFVQGIFLLAVLCIAPFFIVNHVGGWNEVFTYLQSKETLLKFLPTSGSDIFAIFVMAFGWGLGYFGQPHIITKFMGIKDAEEISKSRNVGMIWMILSLAAATVVGLIAISFFAMGIKDPQMVFIEMVKATFTPFFAGLVLCAVLAATINVMSSQLLILSSIISEDVFKRFSKSTPSSQKLLLISRVSVVIATLLAYVIAEARLSSIYHLVYYAWSGLGASFGPLVLAALYSRSVNKYGAFASIIVGGLVSALWPILNSYLNWPLESLIPGFFLSFASIFIFSYLTRARVAVPKVRV